MLLSSTQSKKLFLNPSHPCAIHMNLLPHQPIILTVDALAASKMGLRSTQTLGAAGLSVDGRAAASPSRLGKPWCLLMTGVASRCWQSSSCMAYLPDFYTPHLGDNQQQDKVFYLEDWAGSIPRGQKGESEPTVGEPSSRW